MSRVSVVVPVYKVEQYLERCVKSILEQTYEDFELILVDDGSPDNCPKLCDEIKKTDSRIHVIHQQNGGLSAARNAGIDWTFENSDSEWITFIDSDDWVHPCYLESLLKAAVEFSCPVSMGQMPVTQSYKVDELSEEELQPQLWDTEVAFQEEVLDPNSACCRMFRRELFRDVRFPVGKLHEDRFTTYKLLFLSDKVAVIYAPLYYYFVNAEGIVHGTWTLKKLDDLEATEQQLDFFKKRGLQDSYLYVLNDYVHLLVYSMRNMKGHKEFAKANATVRKKLRSVLREHRDLLGVSFEKNFNIYKYAYPIVAKVYRRINSLRK